MDVNPLYLRSEPSFVRSRDPQIGLGRGLAIIGPTIDHLSIPIDLPLEMNVLALCVHLTQRIVETAAPIGAKACFIRDSTSAVKLTKVVVDHVGALSRAGFPSKG